MAEIPDVQPGQVWADNDKRAAGRTVRVDRIEDGTAFCTILTNRDVTQEDLDRYAQKGQEPRGVRDMRGKPTKIALARFKPTATGYRLAQDAQEVPDASAL